MNKFMKVLTVLLLACLLVSMTACSNSTNIKLPVDDTSTTVTEETVAEVITISETVIYEAADIKITATGLSEGLTGPEVEVLIENNSAENVIITSELVSVNGFMMPYANLYCEVAAGKKANDSINLLNTELQHAKIDKLATIEFRIEVQAQNTYNTIAKSDMITLQTSIQNHTQDVDNTGMKTIYEDENYKIVCKGLLEDDVWEGSLVFYIENNTNRSISVYAENISINNYMNDVTFWCDLKPSTKIIDGLTILEFEAPNTSSITDIKNIELNFRIIDFETWDNLLTTDKVVLTFE